MSPLGSARALKLQGHLDFYFDDVSESSAERNRQSIAVRERVNDEDIGICEADLKSGLNKPTFPI